MTVRAGLPVTQMPVWAVALPAFWLVTWTWLFRLVAKFVTVIWQAASCGPPAAGAVVGLVTWTERDWPWARSPKLQVRVWATPPPAIEQPAAAGEIVQLMLHAGEARERVRQGDTGGRADAVRGDGDREADRIARDDRLRIRRLDDADVRDVGDADARLGRWRSSPSSSPGPCCSRWSRSS